RRGRRTRLHLVAPVRSPSISRARRSSRCRRKSARPPVPPEGVCSVTDAATTGGTDVIVVGAGPGGLFLASELALAGIRCTVLEQRARRTTESRALGLHARSLEAFDLRGIADRFLAKGHPSGYLRITVGSAR